MDEKVKSAVNKLAMTLGVVISLHCFNLNFITILIISISIVFIVSKLFGQPIRDGIEQGLITRDELVNMLFKSPYPWAGFALFIISVIYQGLYS